MGVSNETPWGLTKYLELSKEQEKKVKQTKKDYCIFHDFTFGSLIISPGFRSLAEILFNFF